VAVARACAVEAVPAGDDERCERCVHPDPHAGVEHRRGERDEQRCEVGGGGVEPAPCESMRDQDGREECGDGDEACGLHARDRGPAVDEDVVQREVGLLLWEFDPELEDGHLPNEPCGDLFVLPERCVVLEE
jgi:hypothetical protein